MTMVSARSLAIIMQVEFSISISSALSVDSIRLHNSWWDGTSCLFTNKGSCRVLTRWRIEEKNGKTKGIKKRGLIRILMGLTPSSEWLLHLLMLHPTQIKGLTSRKQFLFDPFTLPSGTNILNLLREDAITIRCYISVSTPKLFFFFYGWISFGSLCMHKSLVSTVLYAQQERQNTPRRAPARFVYLAFTIERGTTGTNACGRASHRE